MITQGKGLSEILRSDEKALLADWLVQQTATVGMRSALLTRGELEEQSRRFLSSLRDAVERGGVDAESPAFAPIRQHLEELSQDRARLGYTPTETATFVFSLKQPIFARLRERYKNDPEALADATWEATQLLDRLGLFTNEAFQKGRDQLIIRQQEEMLELSTPVITLWEGVLALPLIGTLDSARTQIVMENLLNRIVDTGAPLAIIDITGVPTVDTVTAQHLLKTVAAARLMGADCILSGIRPQIAQTIVHLGVDLGDVITKATLADAFAVALKRSGLSIQRAPAAGQTSSRKARPAETEDE
ncbi:MAG TPA: STAS domain-containing protein [Vicinamibacterales bacterium]|jgi:rsbT co-antagonist protein RsbR|nr:STAS domain-containing protein [Vicinamibacterales bacterium]